MLTDRSATVVGGICSASFGVAASSLVVAIPTLRSIAADAFEAVEMAAVIQVLLFVAATPVFF